MPRRPAIFGLRFARHLWALTRIYWKSPDAKWGALLLAGAISLELGMVYANTMIANAQRAIFDALQIKQSAALVTALGLVLGAATAFVLAATLRIYVRQILEIRWRQHMTAYFLERWIAPPAYCQTERHAGEIDNPDQRVAEDIRDFVASSLGLSLSLLSALATLLTFGGLLWRVSRNWPLQAFGTHIHIPGLMMWVAIVFSLLSIVAVHFVGRRLVQINFDKLRVEADFRYGLVRFRDNVERVVLSRGEAVERLGALSRFRFIVLNWWQLIRAQRNLLFVTSGVGQLNDLVPILVSAPAYFASLITLGNIAEVRFAYGQVAGGLSWFVNAYQEIAHWRANVERLCTFVHVMEAAEHDLRSSDIHRSTSEGDVLQLEDLRIESPDGRVLLDHVNASVAPGDRVVILGPSGTGKTMLMRAIVGMWPFGSGRIEVPERPKMMFVPQRPFLPVGSLRAAFSFPSAEGRFPDEKIREALNLFGLGRFANRLDEPDQWEQKLSVDEQQRIGLVRVLLHEPEWVFLDKATSALDADMEKRVYELLEERLPHATLVSVAHRPEIAAFHTRRWTMVPGAEGGSLQAA
jgi:vitamin B12/bleomycin/antimicrobial peptide transport system ATP-binding/permease protein